MKTPYNEIVNIASIGSQTNPISLNEILRKANDEQLHRQHKTKREYCFSELMCSRTSWIMEHSEFPEHTAMWRE